MDKYNLLEALYSKYNELDSLKKYVSDERSLSIIEAKQDTISDIENLIKSKLICTE